MVAGRNFCLRVCAFGALQQCLTYFEKQQLMLPSLLRKLAFTTRQW